MSDPEIQQQLTKYLTDVHSIEAQALIQLRRAPAIAGDASLAIQPGRVIAFRRNERTNDALCRAGLEVLEVPGEELCRGRGPRCLTSPLARDAVLERFDRRNGG